MNNDYNHEFIRTNGILLHVVQAGPENAPLAILLHGFPEFWRGWVKQIGPFAEAGFRVWAPDLRGYNLSDKPSGLDAYRLDRIAGDIAGLIDAAGVQKAALIGHDWGGVAAWVMNILYPQRVERLAILNAPHPAAILHSIFRHPTQLIRSSYVLYFQIPSLPEAMLRANDWELLEEGLLRSSREGTFTFEELEHYREAWWKKGAMTGMLNWYRSYLQRPLKLPTDEQIHIPTLILWGMKDFALDPYLAEESLSLCDEGRLVRFEQASHWIQHEEADAVNRELIEFLR